jgi:kumamolisin
MAQRKVFQDSVTPLPDTPGPGPRGLMVAAAEPETANEEMNVLFSLEIPAAKTADLEERVARGEVLSPDELQQNYAPNAADRDKLVKWLNAQGFDVTGVSHDGSSVYARASVAQIEKSLDVDMVRVTKDGVTYTAAKNAPSLPSNVANGVHAIIGLQPFRQARKQSRMCMPHNGNRTSLNGKSPRSRGRRPAAAAAPVTAIDNAPPYIVPEILKAYGADGLNVTGKGQTIAILIDTFPADSDLKKFWANNNVPASSTRVEKINVKGGSLPPPSGEETLDVEWSSGIAPGATVRVYASGTLQFVDLDRALDRIIADLPSHPGMRQLSISLGLGEKFMGGPNGEVRTQHHKFLMLAAAGVNVFVSSGDAGSKPDDSGHGATGPTQAEYESSDSTVVGVGGTSLKLTPAGAVKSEVGWTSSGGGKSIFFPRPAWQKGEGVPGGRARLVPDVSLVADPGTGAFLVLNGQVVQMGGTSWSAPVWAGFCALLNEARAKARKPFLPYLNPLLYPLQGTACFRDINSGSNGDFTAGPGYDMVTGLGVPNVKELMKALT